MGKGHSVGSSSSFIYGFGGDGNDYIYGPEDSGKSGQFGSTGIKIYGDTDFVAEPVLFSVGEKKTTEGGKDKIFGGDNNMADIFIYGEADDDVIYTGANNEDVTVYGDGECLGGGTACHGNDIIHVENGNDAVLVYGGAGNDKIVGGQVETSQTLFG